jgi:peptide/histidine transporter 3/4
MNEHEKNSIKPEEGKAKSSFFNWWYFGICAGDLASLLILTYIQDNLSWGLGFGIPCVTMMAALAIFLLGTRTYRYSIQGEEKSPFMRIGRVRVRCCSKELENHPFSHSY